MHAGLVANDKNFLLNYWQAEFYLRRGDHDGTFKYLDASLAEDPSVVGNFDQGKFLLRILSAHEFDSVRSDPRFSALAQRAHGELAGGLEPMAGGRAIEAALQDALAGESAKFLASYQQARDCLEHGDLDGAFRQLEASLAELSARDDLEKTLLLLLSSVSFNPLRKDPRFKLFLKGIFHST